MASEKLTTKFVETAKPGRHIDGKGLSLLVKQSGSRSWVLRIQKNGIRRDFGLGSSEILSLSDAREKARQWRVWAAQGKNPKTESSKIERAIPQFQELAIEYLESVKGGWKNPKHAQKWLRSLEAYAFPAIGKMPVNEVGVLEMQRVLAPIWLEKPETASRVRQRMALVIDYAHGLGWRETEEPMRALNSMLPKQKNARLAKYGHFNSLPYKKLPPLMAKLSEGDKTMGRLALSFQILTAARPIEIRFANWSEISFNRCVWELPNVKMKGGIAHTVYLSQDAIAVLRKVQSLSATSRDGYIFVAPRGGTLSDATMNKALRVNGGGNASVHGMRGTFRTWVQERHPSVPDAVAELSIAHKQPDRVVAAYAKAEFVDMRRKLMDDWGDYCAKKS